MKQHNSIPVDIDSMKQDPLSKMWTRAHVLTPTKGGRVCNWVAKTVGAEQRGNFRHRRRRRLKRAGDRGKTAAKITEAPRVVALCAAVRELGLMSILA